MPHVVVVKEVHHAAHLVQVPRLCRGQVSALVSSEIEFHGNSCKAESEDYTEAATEDETEPEMPILRLPLSAVHHLHNFVADVVEQEGGNVGTADDQDWGGETLRSSLEGARQEEAHEDEVDEDKDEGKGETLGVKAVNSVSGRLSEDCCLRAHGGLQTALGGAKVVNIKSCLNEDAEVEKTEGNIADDFAADGEDVEAACLQDEGPSQGVHHRKGLGGDVGVPKLVELDEDQDEHHIHHRGVKLKADVAGTDMEDAAEYSLRDSSSSTKF